MFIILAVLAFGILIFVHELGHFIVAKACGVKVIEFAIGMGPRLLHWQKGETVYAFRALPVGGFCAMEGEAEESDDPRSFGKQSVLRRFLILVAGSFMNFLTGFLLILALYAGAQGFTSNVIAGFFPDCPYEGTLQVGDAIHKVNGHRIYFTGNFAEFAARDADGYLDLVIRRDGETIRLRDYHMVPVEYPTDDGGTELKYGVYFAASPGGAAQVFKYSFYSCLDFVRMVWQGIVELFTGETAMTDVAGVVGIVDIINETGQNAPTVAQGVEDVFYLVAFIAVNLSVMNMLPVPGLDGGHIFTMLVSLGVEKITGKKPDPKIENWIHAAGLVLLLTLMAFVLYNDVARILNR